MEISVVMAVILGKLSAPHTKRKGKSSRKSSSLERNTFKYSGKIMCRFASTANLRVIYVSPLAASVDTNHKYLGFWSARLSELADTFMEYRFTKMKLKFSGDYDALTVTTITYGYMNLVGVAAEPTSQYQVMDMSHSHVILDDFKKPPVHVSIPSQYLMPPLTKWLKCTTIAADDLEIQGTINLWCNAPAVESYVNSVEVDYAVEFRNPIYVQATPKRSLCEKQQDDEKEPDSPIIVPSTSSKVSAVRKPLKQP